MTSRDSVQTSGKSERYTNLMTQLSSEIFGLSGKTRISKEEVKTYLWGNLRENVIHLCQFLVHKLLILFRSPDALQMDVRVGKQHALAFKAQKDVNVISWNRFFCQGIGFWLIYRICKIWDLSLEKDEEEEAEFKAYTPRNN
ncbi:unnamed protein product [Brassica rapa subsp. trilocularis]